MKKLSLIFFFSLQVNSVWSQSDTSFRLIKILKGDIVSFTVDNLDNIYILNSRNQVKKLDANGDSVAIYNDVRKNGNVTLLDASNPMKVLLYYKDFATIVALDRLLNVRNTIDLRKQNILQAKAIGLSYDNKIWVYDELENKLKKIDEDGKLLLETPDFRLLFNPPPSPFKIFDENKYVYLYDSLKGVYVFDYYGALRNNIMIYRWQNFKVAGKYIFGSRNDTLYRYEISSFLYDEWKMPEEIYKSKSFNFTSSRLYALKNDSIEIYALQ
ncbi:MAG: hypothetical protein HOP10_03235 [Chitinophagaceae bacterium]|nr:hypothetical protein [Chitinophagaceae bacterium]